jgi:hypothetical protein
MTALSSPLGKCQSDAPKDRAEIEAMCGQVYRETRAILVLPDHVMPEQQRRELDAWAKGKWGRE